MRGSDENASLYWLGRMLEGGEDPLYVARRMVRFASEDVGKKASDSEFVLNPPLYLNFLIYITRLCHSYIISTFGEAYFF